MAIRVSQEMVRSTLTDFDPDINMMPYIRTANALVDWLDGCDTAGDLSTTELELIEMWLAAHFYAVNDQRLAAESKGKSGATYQGKTDMGLQATLYGQTALLLDTTGCLAKRNLESISGKRTASMSWLGTEFEDLPND